MTIGGRIKARREELGMSQEELARKIGYKSKSSINKIELDVQQLRQSKIKAVADALSTTTNYIMGWDSDSDIDHARRLAAYWVKLQDLDEKSQDLIMERIDTLFALKKRTCDGPLFPESH